MKRLPLYALCCMLVVSLTGCFGGVGDKISSLGSGKGEGNISFEIEGSIWSLDLPDTWEEIEATNYPVQTVLAAQNLTQNLIIEQNPNYTLTIGDDLWEHQNVLFYYFKEVEKSETQWQFQAQSSAEKSLRHYYQKVFQIPGTTNYLLGSCSYEVAFESSDCEAIMDSWNVSTPK